MNRYPLWKNLLIAFVLLLGAIYAAPNLFGEIPAVQITPARPGAPFDARSLAARLEPKLTAAGLAPQGFLFEAGALRVRFADTETQIRAKDLIEAELNPDPEKPEAIVALNLLPDLDHEVRLVSRPALAATSAGTKGRHDQELTSLLDQAFGA